MSLRLALSPELEARLRAASARHGLSLEELALQALEARWGTSVQEARLLKRIHRGFPETFWERYRALVARRERGELTELERQELIQLADEIETRDAARVRDLLSLSRLRNTTVEALVQNLGLTPTPIG
jgi:hypothetical protein